MVLPYLRLAGIAAIVLAAACAPETKDVGDGADLGDLDGDTDVADTDTDVADTDTDAGDTDDTDVADTDDTDGGDTDDTDGGDTDEPDPGTTPVRFVALGDAGEGNDEQYAVADAIEQVCARDGCDFALYLGDNFYDSGVDDVDDSQWDEKFELPYANLDFPFHPALGNHDYGGEGIGWELWKGSIYVDYSAYSDKWVMPDLYYTYTYGDATFYALDTTQVFWGFGDDQLDWLRGATDATASSWRIAYGHHPYVSNGPHGNAGEYEGLDWIPIVNGEAIEEFVDDGICGTVDVYLCGHDHSLQWPESPCAGTEFIVSGAGAKTTELEGDNPTWFEADVEGFLWAEIDGDTFTGVFYDAAGTELYRRSFTR